MPIAMTARYSEQTEGAQICLEKALDLLKSGIEAIPDGGSACFADYGCADGGTALGVYRSFWESLRGRVDLVDFRLSDLPTNDFVGLANSAAKMEDWSDAFVAMVPRSFFLPVLPPGTVDLGFSATAMHWLSQRPEPIRNHTHANACGAADIEARFAAASARDWEGILTLRAAELKPGGHMVTVNLARDAEGHYLGNNGTDDNMHDVIHEEWRRLRDEGLISASEYEAATFQNYYRSESELIAPFAREGAAASAGLELVTSRVEHVPCPYRQRFEADGDAVGFAEGLMRTIRSWSRHTFSTALADRSDGDIIVDLLYDRLRQRYLSEPHRHSMAYVQSYLQFRRRTTHA